MEAKDNLQSEHSTIRRIPKRGLYDRETINSILDSQSICQIAFVWEGRPQIIPTLYGRDGDRLLFHGAVLSRMLQQAQEMEICFSVTCLDSFVLARSAFHHSANYRSVCLYGRANMIHGENEKNEALRLISEHILPGRWQECRSPNSGELKATTVLELKIEEGSAKIRAEGANDDPRDMELDYWVGILPIHQSIGTPIPEADVKSNIDIPKSISILRNDPRYRGQKHQNE